MRLTVSLALATPLILCLSASAMETVDQTDSVLSPDQQEYIFGSGDEVGWNMIADNTYNRSRPGGNWVGTNYYLVGGELNSTEWGINRADKVEIFNGATRTWSMSAVSMPTPVSNIMGSTAVSGGKIYVFGGYHTGAASTDEVQIYDPGTDTWTVGPTAYPAGAHYGCFAVGIGGGKIMTCGGDPGITNTYEYDTATATFTALAPMPATGYHLTGDVDGNTVYVVGGYGAGTSFYSYDVAANSWTVLPNLTLDRAGAGVYADNGVCVISMGNWSAYYNTSTVWLDRPQRFIDGFLPNANKGRRAFAYGLIEYAGTYYLGAFNGYAAAFLHNNEVMDY